MLIGAFQIFYQLAPGGGSFSAKTDVETITLSTHNESYGEGYYEIRSDAGSSNLDIVLSGNGAVSMFGVAMETKGPGITWETFGVAGSSVSSMQKQPLEHMRDQVAARDPALLVYWTGGNELGYPSLKSKTGKVYKSLYSKTVEKLRSGAPQASCLLIGPLDQAKRERGVIVSKPTLENIIRFQREVAEEQGCAYWSARDAMGGKGSFARWLSHKPSLASPDLYHLNVRGRKLIGETMADMIMLAYNEWRMDHPDVSWEPAESIRDIPADPSLWESEQEQNEATAAGNEPESPKG